MKLLYIGHVKENSGWSKAALETITAAHNAGIDVVVRNVQLTEQSKPFVHPLITALEAKPLKDIDVCIQHVLPHHLVGTQKFKKNIAYFDGESSTIKYSSWLEPLQMMDEVWVPNTDLRDRLVYGDIVKKTVFVLPHATNTGKYYGDYKKINLGPHNHKFKFYYIGELNDRKNIETIIRCFHSEFEPHEPVALVLKLKKYGLSREEIQDYITHLSNKIKGELRMFSNPAHHHGEIVIADDLTEEQIYSLHTTCDCFISPSHGEAWSIPAFDAMAFGKTPICTKEGGPRDFISMFKTFNCGYLVDCQQSVCVHHDPAFPDIFTGRETWAQPNELQIKNAMRYYYEKREEVDRKAGLEMAENYSYEAVGNTIKEYLNA
jgi:glycosyltransferase involved in cell wall biosynthesis